MTLGSRTVTSSPLVPLLGIGLAVVVAVATTARSLQTGPVEGGHWWLWLPLRAVMCAAVLVGGRLWLLRRRAALGPLLVAVGGTYFLGDLRASDMVAVHAVGFCLAYLHTAFSMHAALALPFGRLPDRGSRLLAAASYTASVGTQVVRYVVEDPRPPGAEGLSQWSPPDGPHFWTDLSSAVVVVLALVAVVLLHARWRRASPVVRRWVGPALAGALLWAALVVVAAGSSLARLGENQTAVAVAVTAAGLLVVVAVVWRLDAVRVARTRWRLARIVLEPPVADAAGRLPALLQQALRDALGDPGLRLLHPGDGGVLVDATGRSHPSAPVRAGQVATVVPGADGGTVAVLVHDVALEWTADLASIAVATCATVLRQGASADGDALTRLRSEVHDGAQQRFLAAALLLDRARRELEREPGAAALTIEQCRAQLGEAMGALRSVMAGTPDVPDGRTLPDALRGLRDGAPLDLTVAVADLDRAAATLPDRTARAVWFVVSEALANVYRHAAATTARVEVHVEPRRDGGAVVVTVDDDGVGLPAGPAPLLRAVRDRAGAEHGRVETGRSPAGGARVRVVLPLPAAVTGARR